MKFSRTLSTVAILALSVLHSSCAPSENSAPIGLTDREVLNRHFATVKPDAFKDMMAGSIEKSDRSFGMTNLANVSQNTFVSSLPWLREQAPNMSPKFLYIMAIRLLKTDPDEAENWWLIGRLRLMYDVSRCTDRSVIPSVNEWDVRFHSSFKKLKIAPLKPTPEKLQAALDWDINHPPHKFSLRPTCTSGLMGMGQAMHKSGLANQRPFSGAPPGKRVKGHAGRVITLPPASENDESRIIKPASDHPAILEKTRDRYRKSIANLIRRRETNQ